MNDIYDKIGNKIEIGSIIFPLRYDSVPSHYYSFAIVNKIIINTQTRTRTSLLGVFEDVIPSQLEITYIKLTDFNSKEIFGDTDTDIIFADEILVINNKTHETLLLNKLRSE